jgi:hypothetical protein
MRRLFRSKRGKEPSSRRGGSLSTTNVDQPAETLRNASRTSAASLTVIREPAQTLQSSPTTSNRIDKHGLFLLNPQPSHSDSVKVEQTFLLDIVALHGITGDAYDTWTHENGKFWLQDFVPKELPGARIFSFGYPAEVFCSLGTGVLDSFARSLLENLKRERRRKEVGGQFTSDLR